METSVLTTVIHLSPNDAMEVFYFLADMPNTSTSGMYNLFVRNAGNVIPPLEQAVPKEVLDDEVLQLRVVNDLVRSYLIAANKIPNVDINFDLNGEVVTGNLAGSGVLWIFTSESPEFRKYFPYGSVRINILFTQPPAPEILEMMQTLCDRADSLSWKAASSSAVPGGS